MPEGGAIRRPASTMDEFFTGRSVLTSPLRGRSAASAEKINGRVLRRIRVHGKHALVGFVPPEAMGSEPQEWMHIHLGLYGWWRFNGDESIVDEGHGVACYITPVAKGERDGHSETRRGKGCGQAARGEWESPEPVSQVHFRMYNEHAVIDLIGPNRCELISNEERIAAQTKFGPDPLDEGVRGDREVARRFAEVVHAKKRAVGGIVMDQAIIVGVGNIYRTDALLPAGISPYRKGSNISVKRLTDLWALIRDLMNRGLAAGRLETMGPFEAPNPPLGGDEEASR